MTNNAKPDNLEGALPEPDQEARLAAFDASLQRGLADSAAGRVKSAAEVFDRLEAKYQTMAETADPQTGQALIDALARPELADVEFNRVSFAAEVRSCDPQTADEFIPREDWQIAEIEAGLLEADRGEFTSAEDLARVVGKYTEPS